MAYLTKGKAKTWEIRESVSTQRGPRSRTLATFSELDDRILAHAGARASKPLDRDDLCRQALAKGAPIAGPAANRAARTLLGEVARGRTLPPVLADLLAHAVGFPRSIPSAAAQAAAEWLDADAAQRAEALEDVLLLADSVPATPRPKTLAFPPLRSRPA
jgi:hypothetical protein